MRCAMQCLANFLCGWVNEFQGVSVTLLSLVFGRACTCLGCFWVSYSDSDCISCTILVFGKDSRYHLASLLFYVHACSGGLL